MFKKLIAILFLVTTAVSANEFKEGEHYLVIADKAAASKEVREYFSFYCPHCYRQEPLMKQIKQTLPSGVRFVKNHVDSMPGRDVETEQMLTQAAIAAKLLKVEQPVVDAIFKRIHVEKKSLSNDDIIGFFKQAGIDEAKYNKVAKGFSARSLFKVNQKNTTNLRAKGYTSVPTVVINGKYKIESQNMSSIEQYLQLVDYLVNKQE